MAFYDKLNKALELIDELELDYPVVLDRNGDVTEEFYFQFTPATFFIDEDGIIRNMIQGIMSEEFMLGEIENTRKK